MGSENARSAFLLTFDVAVHMPVSRPCLDSLDLQISFRCMLPIFLTPTHNIQCNNH